jgi:hypothetical protein
MNPSTLLRLRLALSLVGFLIWAWGARSDNRAAMWVGIGFMGLAVIARFFGPRPARRPPSEP